MLYEIFKTMLLLGGIFVMAMGLISSFALFFRLKAPADQSNRFNRLRLWWFWASAPHRFVDFYPEKSMWWIFKEIILRPETFVEIFPWMTGDEKDNLKDAGKWQE
jgi:hypothetical protein